MPTIITFYDDIVPGLASQVVGQLRQHQGGEVVVRINSPGGSVAEGIAIFNALKPYNPTCYVDGIAASIASLILMAGARRIGAENAIVMIHDPWTDARGNSADLRQVADALDTHRAAMLTAYQRTGVPGETLLAMLAAETWMNAEEAMRFGFLTEIAEPVRFAAHAPGSFARYRKTPEFLLMPQANQTPGQQPPNPQNPNPGQQPPNPGPQWPSDPDAMRKALQTGLSSQQVADAAYDAIAQSLQARNATMVATAEPHMHIPEVARIVARYTADPRARVEDFNAECLRAVGAWGGGSQFSVMAGASIRDPRDSSDPRTFAASRSCTAPGDFVAAASDALVIRAGLAIDKPHPGVRDLSGMNLMALATACVQRSGRSAGFGDSPRNLIRAAMTTGDFPGILENALNKSLRNGYEAEPGTFTMWTRKVDVPDFKPQSRPILGSVPDLLHVNEAGEYQNGALDDDKALPYAVGKYGRLVSLTWEAMVNDDLGAFLRMVQGLGQAASRAEADKVYASFAENSGAGPTMQDASPLFHSSHNNITANQAGIDADALSAARVLLRRQRAVGGGFMNLPPRFLLLPPEYEQGAEVLIAAAARAVSQGTDPKLIAAWISKLEPVVEPRLAVGAFYLATSAEAVDTYERAWLAGEGGPTIETETGFVNDVMQYKARHVFGGRWLDFRGVVKVPIQS